MKKQKIFLFKTTDKMGNKKRVKDGIKYGIIYTEIIMFLGIIALECGSGSLIVSLLRLLIVPLPLAYIFTLTNNAKSLIWWAFPIGEFVAFIAAIIIMKKIFRKNGLTKTETEEVFL